MPDDDKSLGGDKTFSGQPKTPPESEQSLGDAGTHTGGGDSSLSDLDDPGDPVDFDLPLIDLAARYKIEGELGKGGMGAVQLATDRSLKRKVAIKRIHASSPAALKRFVTEAQSIAALSHFNIVQVHEFERDEEGPFLVLEYVSGGSLLDKLKEGKLEVEDAVGITCQLCDALALAHGKGIIHRDIKPANILLTEDGIPKLTDFGLARDQQADHGQTMTGAVMGTLDFMSPEQRRDATAVDARSDLWSLAATLYQMLTGKNPRIIRLDQLPANMAQVIGTMLEEDPEERYQSAGEFKAELQKGMATAVAPVTVDLVAGICPSCGTPNEANRKFCQKCADALSMPCLSCNEEIAVWHNVCGQCGCKQDEQRELIRGKLTIVIEESTALAHGHEYEKALAGLNTVQEDSHAFTEDLLKQAAEQVKLITVQRDRQYQLRDQQLERADQHQQIYDYVGVAKELASILGPLRTEIIEERLTKAGEDRAEVSSLIREIKESIKAQQTDGLLKKTGRYLKLKPNAEQVQKLHLTLKKKAEELRTANFFEDGIGLINTEPTKTLTGHNDLICSVAFSPDGTRIVSGSFDKTIIIWDAARGEKLQTLSGHRGNVYCVAFSPDSKRVVSGSRDKTIKVWYAGNGKELQTLSGHRGPVNSVAFSPDGNYIASGSWDKTVRTWDATTGKQPQSSGRFFGGLLRNFVSEPHQQSIYCVAFDPDGKRTVSGSGDNTIKIWESATGKELHTLRGHENWVYSVAFSPDGKSIVSGSWDKTIKIWSAGTGRLRHTLRGHEGYVISVAFSPDGKHIVSGSRDKTVKIWNVHGKELQTLTGHTGPVNSVIFSPDGKQIISGSGDNSIKIWEEEGL
jgi:WD40 repeat protein